MRALAAEFTGFHTHPVERQLRVLPQPLYRYSNSTHPTIDGSVFGLFMDWDPEIMLTIEARQTGTESKWHFGVGRFSDRPLRLQHKGVDVWRHAGGDFGDPRGPFFAVHGVEYRDGRPEK
jgi:hypothetical protein